MPPIVAERTILGDAWTAPFSAVGTVKKFIVFVFFVGDMLMSGRLALVGRAAIFDRFRPRESAGGPRHTDRRLRC